MSPSRKNNILYICSSLAWGGGEKYSVELAKSFLQRNYEVIFAAHTDSRILMEARKATIKVVPLRFIRYFDPGTVIKLVHLIRSYRIDIIHCHLSRDLSHLYWAVKLCGNIPVVLHKHVASGVLKKDLLHRRLYSVVTKIIVLSNFIKNQ